MLDLSFGQWIGMIGALLVIVLAALAILFGGNGK